MGRAEWPKHAQEDPASAEFHSHTKQLIIFTPAGKPVFTRYGNVMQIATTTATLAAIVSYSAQDPLRSLVAGDACVVFDTSTPLWYCVVSRSGEDQRVLEAQCAVVSHVLHSVVSPAAIRETLGSSSNFDMRRVVAGYYGLLKTAVSVANVSVACCIGATSVHPLPAEKKQKLGEELAHAVSAAEQQMGSDRVMAMFIFYDNALIHTYCRRGVKFSARDILALVTHINSMRRAGKKVLQPVCLSDYNGFVQEYGLTHNQRAASSSVTSTLSTSTSRWSHRRPFPSRWLRSTRFHWTPRGSSAASCLCLASVRVPQLSTAGRLPSLWSTSTRCTWRAQ